MTHVAELLSVWRDAERVLDSLSPVSPDRETVALAVVRLRTAYQSITDGRPASQEAVATSAATMRDAHALLAEVRIKSQEPERSLTLEPSGRGG